MKIIKLICAIAIISLIAVSCKETKKDEPTEDSIEVTEESVESGEATSEEEVVESSDQGTTNSDAVSNDEAATEESSEEVVETEIETATSDVEELKVEEGIIIEKLADTPVIYPGCEEGTSDEIRACSIKKFKNFLGSNFDKDLSSGLDLNKGEHKIRALLKIDKTGKVSVRKIVASRVELENEIIRIIGKLPNMTPATKGGSPVDVSFVVPVDFKVEGY